MGKSYRKTDDLLQGWQDVFTVDPRQRGVLKKDLMRSRPSNPHE